MDVDRYLQNKNVVEYLIRCVVYNGPCDQIGQEIKRELLLRKKTFCGQSISVVISINHYAYFRGLAGDRTIKVPRLFYRSKKTVWKTSCSHSEELSAGKEILN